MPKDEFDPEDPMELVGVELPSGDSLMALEDIVQEYLFMGWKPAMILFLFRSPHYGATHNIYKQLGHDHVRERIYSLTEQWNQGWLVGGESHA